MRNVYFYPRECFTPNTDTTSRRMKDYEKRVNTWYDTAEKLYPNYFKMGLKERLKVRSAIDAAAGFSI